MKASEAWSLRNRTLAFLALLTLFSGLGVGLLWNSQEKLNETSQTIQQVLVPAVHLVDKSRTELEWHLQNLAWLAREGPRPDPDLQKHLELPLSVRALRNLHRNHIFPPLLSSLFQPWSESVENYEKARAEWNAPAQAIPRLQDLRDRTRILQRAVDRELSVQLLRVTKGGGDHIFWGFLGFLAASMLSIVFVLLLRSWMKPLSGLQRWMEALARNESAKTFSEILPPPSAWGAHLLAPPREVQNLVEAFRQGVQRFQSLDQALSTRAEKTAENERALLVLFSALLHLTRHNEELLKELIKSERLASMGEMAAQLAHEIRNPLNSLNLKLELLRERLDADLQTELDRVLGEIDRLDALTESHLRTTRAVLKGDNATVQVAEESNLSQVLESVLENLQPTLSEQNILIQKKYHNPDLCVPVPPNILKAALLNFAKNAVEALENTSDPLIQIATGSDAARQQWWLTLSDTGCGIPEDILRSGPMSFCTTKHQGSGLGLSTSQKMTAPFGVQMELRSPAGSFATEVRLSGPLNQDRLIQKTSSSRPLQSDFIEEQP